ncbi:hypothetical protein ACGFIY_18985 [Micromonospora chersina]|uniref:hypothetical protein n=1 Tax=Micromonospora chersina TaxID=47854 RepID=UPI0037191DCD
MTARTYAARTWPALYSEVATSSNAHSLASYLGHSDPGFTLRVYTHLLPDSEERTRSAIDRTVPALGG